MTFLMILVVTEILCSFRLVLEKEKGKIRKIFNENFALSDAKDITSGPLLNRGGIADLL